MTSDQTRIFYNTNFPVKDYDPQRPLIIFNYGLVCNPQHFKFQYPFFEQQNYQMLVYNYRGHFNSSGHEDIPSCTFQNMAKDIFELLKSLNFKNYLFLGHSMGVNVCLEFARYYPQELNSLILLSGTVLPPQEVMFNTGIVEFINPLIEVISKNYPDVMERIWKSNFLNPLNYTLLYKGGFNTKQVSIEFVQYYAKKISELPHKLFLQLMQEMRNHDIYNELENITTPTLVIGGDEDKVIPLHLQFILNEKLPNSQLYILKDGSHVPQSDFPDLLNERMDLFIQNNYPQVQ